MDTGNKTKGPCPGASGIPGIRPDRRWALNGHRGHCFWLTGLSGSGKSSLARDAEERYFRQGRQVYVLDGDCMRRGLSADLGFSPADRAEHIRRMGHLARVLYDAGFIVLAAFITPSAGMRASLRALFPEEGFSEVYLKASLDCCAQRDPKGLYRKAMAGELPDFTGVSAPYDIPEKPDLILDTENNSLEVCVTQLMDSVVF